MKSNFPKSSRFGFKLKDKVNHKSSEISYGDCIIIEFDDFFEETVLIRVPTYSEYNKSDGYDAYVDIGDLTKGWELM